MKQIVGILALIVGVVVSGCGPGTAKVSTDVPKVLSKWKYQPKSAVGSPMGIIIESENDMVTAVSVHRLKDGPGFVLDEAISANKFVERDGVLVIPIGLPPFATVKDWLAENGSCWEVTFNPKGNRLIAKFKSPGVPNDPMEFLPFLEKGQRTQFVQQSPREQQN